MINELRNHVAPNAPFKPVFYRGFKITTPWHGLSAHLWVDTVAGGVWPVRYPSVDAAEAAVDARLS